MVDIISAESKERKSWAREWIEGRSSPYTIDWSPHLSLKDCMQKIEQNRGGFIVVQTAERVAVGVLTDGDIRRALLAGASIDASVEKFLVRNFVHAQEDASREKILKLLDTNIRFVPILRDQKLLDIVTLNDLEYRESGDMTTRAKAPARISFGGGGTDLTPFFLEHGGAVLNAAINLFSHATLSKHSDTQAITIRSLDFDLVVEATNAESLVYDGKLDLIKAAIKLIRPDFGFDLEIYSDFPPSSGLGGSSVVLAAVIGAFNELRRDRLDPYDIAELAFQAERLELMCSGGWQDQYAAVFGGINFMEFRKERNEINTLRIAPDILYELEERLLLCFSGKSHPINKIHDSQKKKMSSDQEVTGFARRTRDIAYEMKFQLLRGNLDVLGTLLHEAWTIKKTFNDEISNQEIDDIYSFAKQNGAVGGKLLGAGGGGYFLFQAHKNQRGKLKRSLLQRGLETKDVTFEQKGLRSWSIRL